jgi:hypothetical protein
LEKKEKEQNRWQEKEGRWVFLTGVYSTILICLSNYSVQPNVKLLQLASLNSLSQFETISYNVIQLNNASRRTSPRPWFPQEFKLVGT